MKTTFIYALCEPGTRTVRYIGKADRPKKRFGQHIRESAKKKSHLGHWLKALKVRGERPELVVLREVLVEHWGVAEERYIRLARGCGMKLVNSIDGGKGGNPSPETREKIGAPKRGVPLSPAHCEALSRALTGRTLPPEQRENISLGMAGKIRLPSHCAALSASHTGVKRAGASSKFQGVYWRKESKKWRANLKVGGKNISLGHFLTEEDAARAYDTRAILLFGPDANLNFPST